MRALLPTVAFLAALAAPAAAQWWVGGGSTAGSLPCAQDNTWTIDPRSADLFGFRFVGRTLVSDPAPTVAVALRKTATADASPAAISLGNTPLGSACLFVRPTTLVPQ